MGAPRKSELPHAIEDLGVELVSGVPLAYVWLDLSRAEVAHRRLDEPVLLTQ